MMYPLRYIMIPPITINVMSSLGLALIVAGRGGSKADILAAAGLGLMLGWLPALWFTAQLFIAIDPAIRQKVFELRNYQDFQPQPAPKIYPNLNDEPEPITMLISTGNETQRVRGIPLAEWEALAETLVENGFKFRVGTVGRMRHDLFRPVLEANPHLCTVGGDRVIEPTTQGKALFSRIYALPHPLRETPVFLSRMVR